MAFRLFSYHFPFVRPPLFFTSSLLSTLSLSKFVQWRKLQLYAFLRFLRFLPFLAPGTPPLPFLHILSVNSQLPVIRRPIATLDSAPKLPPMILSDFSLGTTKTVFCLFLMRSLQFCVLYLRISIIFLSSLDRNLSVQFISLSIRFFDRIFLSIDFVHFGVLELITVEIIFCVRIPFGFHKFEENPMIMLRFLQLLIFTQTCYSVPSFPLFSRVLPKRQGFLPLLEYEELGSRICH